MGGEGGEQFKDPTAVLSVTLSVSSAVCLSLAQMAMGAAVRRARWNTIARFLFPEPCTRARAAVILLIIRHTHTRERTASGQNPWPPVSFYDVIFSNCNLERTQLGSTVCPLNRFALSFLSFLPSFLSTTWSARGRLLAGRKLVPASGKTEVCYVCPLWGQSIAHVNNPPYNVAQRSRERTIERSNVVARIRCNVDENPMLGYLLRCGYLSSDW